jgi:hypothetical protein
MRRSVLAGLVLCVLLASSVFAQQTTGNISGRVVDQQGASIPGATVTATNAATGFLRTVVSDSVGIYTLTALPVGSYDVKVELSGFQPTIRKGLVVNLSQTLSVDLSLSVAALAENVTVTGEVPLVQTTNSTVGGVVDVNKIEALPLNGRQFANLAMTVAGVAMGFHSDPTKSTQYSPQIAGGNGRNVNYQIDGGDNNDDTVGGLLQLFPLEAIQEFNMITSRYKAEYGRSNGGVMNIVTKSGTNRFGGSWFTLFRNDAMNAVTEREHLTAVQSGQINATKSAYKRYQFGGSFGGPIIQNKAHFFLAAERTDQTTQQIVSVASLFAGFNKPTQAVDGVYDLPMAENLFTVKSSANLTANQYLSVRYGRNTNSQVYGVGSRATPDNWGDSKNTFNSINVNHNWVLGGSKLNEIIFQYADFANNITGRTTQPGQTFPNGVSIGLNANVPQTTIQHKWQFRDDFSWHTAGKLGLGHDFKLGFNLVYEPKLFVTFNSGSLDYSYTHLDNNVDGKISAITRNKDGSAANLPMKQYGVYFQDDWKLRSNVTINAGIRYDLVTGFAIDQGIVPNFQILQKNSQAGVFNGVPGFDQWGASPREDYNNVQPRVGLAWDVRGNGKDIVRTGWGIYYDFGYTNANILFPGLSAQGGSGQIFAITGKSSGLLKADGTYFKVGDAITTVASQNEVNAALGFWSSNVAVPRVKQPYTKQFSGGWSHQITASTVLDVDYIMTRGHDLGVRWPLNTRINGGNRRFQSLGFSPANPTMNMSVGASKFDGLQIGIRRRMDHHVSFNAWYALNRAVGLGGLGIDELTTNLVQDATNPFADVQWGPAARTDARHKFTVSAVLDLPYGINVSPIFRYRSALPMHIWTGYDVNNDGVNNDIYTKAYQFDSIGDSGIPIYKEIGACTAINCGRGAPQAVFNLRAAKVFSLPRNMKLEAIAEVFNLFNAMNPNFGVGAASSSRIYTGTAAAPVANSAFMVPTSFAGDSGNTEQRIGQIGFRFTF